MSFNPEHIRKRVQEAQKLFPSRRRMAAAMGCDEKTLRSILSGETAPPRVDTAYKLADVLRVPIWDILGEPVPYADEVRRLRATMHRFMQRQVEDADALRRGLAELEEILNSDQESGELPE